MSFGKNLGGEAATGEVLVFVDADTVLPPDGIRVIVEEMHGRGKCVGTVAGAPDRGGGVVRFCFWLANRHASKKQYHAPGGVMLMQRTVWAETRFDEQLPQGTSTDFILRAREKGAAYAYVDRFSAVTSIRRFEKKGIVRQMLSWRKNHRDFVAGRHANVRQKEYEVIREKQS